MWQEALEHSMIMCIVRSSFIYLDLKEEKVQMFYFRCYLVIFSSCSIQNILLLRYHFQYLYRYLFLFLFQIRDVVSLQRHYLQLGNYHCRCKYRNFHSHSFLELDFHSKNNFLVREFFSIFDPSSLSVCAVVV